CAPGAMETQGCGDAGEQMRACDDTTCTWGEWGMCEVIPCTDNDMEACFTGSTAERGVGACMDGTSTCVAGVWSECMGETLAVAEICDDSVDNDCDGATDAADDDC